MIPVTLYWMKHPSRTAADEQISVSLPAVPAVDDTVWWTDEGSATPRTPLKVVRVNWDPFGPSMIEVVLRDFDT